MLGEKWLLKGLPIMICTRRKWIIGRKGTGQKIQYFTDTY